MPSKGDVLEEHIRTLNDSVTSIFYNLYDTLDGSPFQISINYVSHFRAEPDTLLADDAPLVEKVAAFGIDRISLGIFAAMPVTQGLGKSLTESVQLEFPFMNVVACDLRVGHHPDSLSYTFKLHGYEDNEGALDYAKLPPAEVIADFLTCPPNGGTVSCVDIHENSLDIYITYSLDSVSATDPMSLDSWVLLKLQRFGTLPQRITAEAIPHLTVRTIKASIPLANSSNIFQTTMGHEAGHDHWVSSEFDEMQFNVSLGNSSLLITSPLISDFVPQAECPYKLAEAMASELTEGEHAVLLSSLTEMIQQRVDAVTGYRNDVTRARTLALNGDDYGIPKYLQMIQAHLTEQQDLLTRAIEQLREQMPCAWSLFQKVAPGVELPVVFEKAVNLLQEIDTHEAP